MKLLFTILCFLTLSAHAADRPFVGFRPAAPPRTYYIAANGSDSYTAAQAQNAATPWASIDKVNENFGLFLPGDNILFRRGDTFYGTLKITKNGTVNSPIYIGAYGSGAPPVLTGFKTLGGWTDIGGGLYESAAFTTLATCNQVAINGVNTGMGRYPNRDAAKSGYLMPDGSNGSNQLTDTGILNAGKNFVGATMVSRRHRWFLTRYEITAQSGGTITYSPSHKLTGLNGFWVQNHRATLDQFGEWFFNSTTKKLTVFFGTAGPGSNIVKAAAVPIVVDASNNSTTTQDRSYITIEGLQVEGANEDGIYFYSGDGITARANIIKFCGGQGIRMQTSKNILIETNTVKHAGNFGIYVGKDGSTGGFQILGNNVDSIGMIPGAGVIQDNNYDGIRSYAPNTTIAGNTISNTNQSGIRFLDNEVEILNNFLFNNLMITDDAGAIYTAQTTSLSNNSFGRRIIGNVCINGGAPLDGYGSVNGASIGIYMDDNSNHVDIQDNVVSNFNKDGIYLHNARNITATRNTLFNCKISLFRIVHNTPHSNVRDVVFKHNILLAKEAAPGEPQALLHLQTDTTDVILDSMGIIDSNFYASPADFTKNFKYRTPFKDYFTSFADWKTQVKYDDNSKLSTKSFIGSANPLDSVRFEVNPTAQAVTIPLGRRYIDPTGAVYNGTVTLQPFTGVALMADGIAPGTTPTPVAYAGLDSLIFKNQTRPDSARLDASASQAANTFNWAVVSYPAGTTAPAIASSSSSASWLTGLKEGVTKVRLQVNGNAAYTDTMTILVRDFMKKNVTASRPGGGIDIVIPYSAAGTYISNGQTKTWGNLYAPDLNSYLVSKGLPAPMGGDRLWHPYVDSLAFIEVGNFGGNMENPVTVLIGHPTDASRNKAIVTSGADWRYWVGVRDSNVVCHVNFDFTNQRINGAGYGLTINNSALNYESIKNGAANAKWVHHVNFSGIHGIKNRWGMQIQIYATALPFSKMDKFIQRKISIIDNWFEDAYTEGLYIGKTAVNTSIDDNGVDHGPAPRMDSVEIAHNVVTNPGWDGVQVTNGRNGNSIHDNVVTNTGILTGSDEAQQAGILMGSNTNGNIFNNLVLGSRGNAIQHFGYGQVSVYNNYTDSSNRTAGTSDALFFRSTPVLYDGAANPQLRVTATGNILGRNDRYHIGFLVNSSFPQLGAVVNSNTFLHPTATSATGMISGAPTGSTIGTNTVKNTPPTRLVSIATDANGPVITLRQGFRQQIFKREGSVSATTAASAWVFALNNGTIQNQAPTVNIPVKRFDLTLPANALTLTASGADADGTITYKWTKVSGPDVYAIIPDSEPTVAVSGLVAGTYVFRLTVTDNEGAAATDDVTVQVSAAEVAGETSTPVVKVVTVKTANTPTVRMTFSKKAQTPTVKPKN